MKPEEWTTRLEALFLEVVELADDEREALLASAARDDPALAAEVRSLLTFDRPDDGFLHSPIVRSHVDDGRAEGDAPPAPAAMPTRIGRYRIIRTIAAGGMGTVFEAAQDQPRRTVALKLMRRGATSSAALRRFEHESQILARLHHPMIAQVYDVGMHDDGSGGVPYFVMEFIPEARTLTEYARSADLGTRDRLRLFVSVCDAVQHGHQKGIIHRDLKPGNILVDESGRPKIIDFGVARATDSDVTITTMGTDVGQLVGTLAYMSPEQCAADPDDLDTRSDVYSLGVVLYELLCDRLPYDLSRVPIPEAARVIREETLEKPSTINRTLRGDVETIVLKALEKDRDRRYQSAADLGRDIDRYLKGEPIDARPPSAAYRLRTFARRHKVATTILLMLLVSVVALAAATVIATTSARRAKAAQLEAEAITDFVTDALRGGGASPPDTRGLLVVDAMEHAIARLDSGKVPIQPRTEIALRRTISTVLHGNAGIEQAVQQAERALQISRSLYPEDSHEVVNSMSFLAHRLSVMRPDDALAIWRTCLEVEQRLHPGDHRHVPETMHNIAHALSSAGRPEEAIPILEASLAMKRRLGSEVEQASLATSTWSLANCMMQAGREDEALSVLEAALEMERQGHGEAGSTRIAYCLSAVGRCLYVSGRPAEALEWHERALEMSERLVGDDHQSGEWIRMNLAQCLDTLGRSEEGLSRFQAKLERDTRYRGDGEDYRQKPSTLAGIARCLLSLHRPEEALPYARDAVATDRRLLTVKTRYLAAHLTVLASCLASLNQWHEALPAFEEAMEINGRVLPPGHPDALRTQIGLARTLVTIGRYAEAEPVLLGAAAHCERSEAARRWHRHAVYEESVRLHEAWHAAEPDAGHDAKAAAWRDKLRAHAEIDDAAPGGG